MNLKIERSIFLLAALAFTGGCSRVNHVPSAALNASTALKELKAIQGQPINFLPKNVPLSEQDQEFLKQAIIVRNTFLSSVESGNSSSENKIYEENRKLEAMYTNMTGLKTTTSKLARSIILDVQPKFAQKGIVLISDFAVSVDPKTEQVTVLPFFTPFEVRSSSTVPVYIDGKTISVPVNTIGHFSVGGAESRQFDAVAKAIYGNIFIDENRVSSEVSGFKEISVELKPVLQQISTKLKQPVESIIQGDYISYGSNISKQEAFVFALMLAFEKHKVCTEKEFKEAVIAHEASHILAAKDASQLLMDIIDRKDPTNQTRIENGVSEMLAHLTELAYAPDTKSALLRCLVFSGNSKAQDSEGNSLGSQLALYLVATRIHSFIESKNLHKGGEMTDSIVSLGLVPLPMIKTFATNLRQEFIGISPKQRTAMIEDALKQLQ